MTDIVTDDAVTAPAAAPAAPAGRPPHVPEKFWDPATGTIRVDALLKSYLELEQRLSAPMSRPGIPAGPDDYCIDCAHGLFEPDSDINSRLHGAGFAPEQAQLVYDLAAERLVPLIQEIAAEMAAERDMERLVEHFGGEDGWREASRQIHAWAQRNMPTNAVDSLSTSYDGVLALHRLMSGGEPAALRPGAAAEPQAEDDLHRMMRDPRYWRDRDPTFVGRVTEGYRRLYPDRG